MGRVVCHLMGCLEERRVEIEGGEGEGSDSVYQWRGRRRGSELE